MRLLQFRTIVYARIYGCLSVARLHECFYSGIKRPRRVTRPCSILDFGWRILGRNVEPPATAGGTDRKRTTPSATYKTCGCHPSFVRRRAKGITPVGDKSRKKGLVTQRGLFSSEFSQQTEVCWTCLHSHAHAAHAAGHSAAHSTFFFVGCVGDHCFGCEH